MATGAGGTFASASTTIQGDYFVATNGSDSNPGTISQPFRTIAKGVSMLTPGKTLLVRSGTYAESLQNTIPGGTSWSSPVTVAAYPGDTVTIEPTSQQNAQSVLMFYGASEQYIIVQGFIINAQNVTHDAVKITNSSSAGAASHIRITDCEVENAPQNGILTSNGAVSNEFLNLLVHNNGSTNYLYHGFYISTQSNTVSGSTSYSNGGRGIQVYAEGSTTKCNNNVISGNKCYNNGLSGRGPGISVASGTGIQVYNNICYGNTLGIQVDYWNPTNTRVVNNTVDGNGSDGGIYIGTVATGTLVENNIVYNNTLVNMGISTSLAMNLVGVNPLFVNLAGHDYHLTSGSPAIDAGTATNAPSTAFDGSTRPLVAGFDIGAYEWVPPTDTVLPTSHRVLHAAPVTPLPIGR